MKLIASQIWAEVDEEDEPFARVYVRDAEANYIFSLSRHMDDDSDNGKIEIMVLDQINGQSADVAAQLYSNRLDVQIPEALARKLDCPSSFEITFHADKELQKQIATTLRIIFCDLHGFTEGEAQRSDVAGHLP